jgi:hypothetical protein
MQRKSAKTKQREMTAAARAQGDAHNATKRCASVEHVAVSSSRKVIACQSQSDAEDNAISRSEDADAYNMAARIAKAEARTWTMALRAAQESTCALQDRRVTRTNTRDSMPQPVQNSLI